MNYKDINFLDNKDSKKACISLFCVTYNKDEKYLKMISELALLQLSKLMPLFCDFVVLCDNSTVKYLENIIFSKYSYICNDKDINVNFFNIDDYDFKLPSKDDKYYLYHIGNVFGYEQVLYLDLNILIRKLNKLGITLKTNIDKDMIIGNVNQNCYYKIKDDNGNYYSGGDSGLLKINSKYPLDKEEYIKLRNNGYIDESAFIKMINDRNGVVFYSNAIEWNSLTSEINHISPEYFRKSYNKNLLGYINKDNIENVNIFKLEENNV